MPVEAQSRRFGGRAELFDRQRKGVKRRKGDCERSRNGGGLFQNKGGA